MKTHIVYILIIITILAGGLAYLFKPAPPPPPATVPLAMSNRPKKKTIKQPPKAQATRPALSETTPEPMEETTTLEPQIKETPQEIVKTTTHPNEAYWQSMARHFDQQQERLQRESDPNKRLSLIQAMARNVRVNTPATLDWAMALENPEEKRAALEAINQNALVGIGARIDMDETGLPKVVYTTALSAIGATGQVESGDYISGMVDENGTIIDFQNMPIQRVVNYLRGEAGTKVQLLMQRAEGNGETYNLSVPRSLIVVQPPYE